MYYKNLSAYSYSPPPSFFFFSPSTKQEVFQTESLTFQDIIYILLLTSSLLVLDTCRKFLLRPRIEGKTHRDFTVHVPLLDSWKAIKEKKKLKGGGDEEEEERAGLNTVV